MKSFAEFLSEGNPLSRILSLKAKNVHFAMVSPDRTNRSPAENKAAAQHLEKSAKAAGFGFRRAQGEYNEGDGVAKERAYQVIAKGSGKKHAAAVRRFARKMGSELNQQSVIHNMPSSDSRRGGESKVINTTNYKDWQGNDQKVGQRTSYGSMHFNTPNEYGITRFKKGQTFTYK